MIIEIDELFIEFIKKMCENMGQYTFLKPRNWVSSHNTRQNQFSTHSANHEYPGLCLNSFKATTISRFADHQRPMHGQHTHTRQMLIESVRSSSRFYWDNIQFPSQPFILVSVPGFSGEGNSAKETRNNTLAIKRHIHKSHNGSYGKKRNLFCFLAAFH